MNRAGLNQLRKAIVSPVSVRRFAFAFFSLVAFTFTSEFDARQTHAQDSDSNSEIAEWIEQLSNVNSLVRESAKARLKLAGSSAYGPLDRNRKTGSLESRLLIEELLLQIKFSWVSPSDSPSVKNLMYGYADRKASDRIAIVDQLALLPTAQSWTALSKIVQFDRASDVSNRAARACLQALFVRDGITDRTALQFAKGKRRGQFGFQLDSIPSIERDSLRAVALVFCLATKFESIAKPTLKTQSAENKTSNERQASNEKREIAELLIGLPTSLQKPILQSAYQLCDQSPAAEKFLDEICIDVIQTDDTDVLETTIEALFVAERFDLIVDIFKAKSNLVSTQWIMPFILAETHYLRGETEAGNKIVTWAAGKSSPFEAARQRLPILNALTLESNGLVHSAEFLLSSDQGKKSLATELRLASYEIKINKFEAAFGRIEKALESPQLFPALKVQSYMLLAEIAKAKRDLQQQAEWLTKVLVIEPANAAAAVQLFLAAQSLSGDMQKIARQKVDVCIGIQRDRNRKATEMERSSIPAEQNIGEKNAQASANALAWLFANTGGDIEQALKFAKLAAQAIPSDSSTLDTLAFCHFKSGDQNAAIITQRHAVFLKPFDKSFQQRLKEYESR